MILISLNEVTQSIISFLSKLSYLIFHTVRENNRIKNIANKSIIVCIFSKKINKIYTQDKFTKTKQIVPYFKHKHEFDCGQ